MNALSRALSALLCVLLLGGALVPLPTQAQSSGSAADSSYLDEMEYRMIGPYRGGRSTAVTGVADKPSTYYMGTTGGGVWKTTNDGQDWHNISDGEFNVSSIGGIDVANSDPNIIYVGTGSACMRGNVQTGRGVYKSTDGGDSWSFVGLPEAGLIGKVAVHPEDPDVAYVAAVGHPFGDNEQRGVFRTTDGGKNWEKVLYISDSTGVVDLALNPNNPREIYAGLWPGQRKPWTMISGSKEGGIFKSTDGGDNWTRLKGGLPQGVVGKTSVTVSPAKPSRVWALIEAPEPKGGLYRSDDHGKTWTQVNDNRKHQQRAWYYTHIYAHPTDPNTVYSLNTNFYESVDGGKSFERYGVPHGDEHDLWINPEQPNRMVLGNDGGAQVTVDGAETWSTMFNQPTAEMYSVTVDDEFPYNVYGPQQDNSTIRLPSTANAIHPKSNWTEVGGCET
ncbi:MAG: WD40/YVTN/BNR-like repeat-containing protein, partial [Salinibacter sp.]